MPQRQGRQPHSDRGFALLLVLWSLVLLTLITTRLIASGRDEARLTSNLRAAAQAEMLADAAVNEAVFRLLTRTPGWSADGQRHRAVLPGGVADILIEDEAARVNPNQASAPLLQALLQATGADAGTARSIAAAIMDWRATGATARQFGAKLPEYSAAGRDFAPPQSPFRSVDEVGLVLGMTPALLARISPYLSVFYDGDPDPETASPLVLAALKQAAGQANIGGSGQAGRRTVRLTASAAGTAGGRFVRRAVVQLVPDSAARPYRLLDWRRG